MLHPCFSDRDICIAGAGIIGLSLAQLPPAFLGPVHPTPIDPRPNPPVLPTRSSSDAIEIQTPTGTVHAKQFVDCPGAWASITPRLPDLQVAPKKGQMLAVSLP